MFIYYNNCNVCLYHIQVIIAYKGSLEVLDMRHTKTYMKHHFTPDDHSVLHTIPVSSFDGSEGKRRNKLPEGGETLVYYSAY